MLYASVNLAGYVQAVAKSHPLRAVTVCHLIKGPAVVGRVTGELDAVKTRKFHEGPISPPSTPFKKGPIELTLVSDPCEYAIGIECRTLEVTSPTVLNPAALIRGS